MDTSSDKIKKSDCIVALKWKLDEERTAEHLVATWRRTSDKERNEARKGAENKVGWRKIELQPFMLHGMERTS